MNYQYVAAIQQTAADHRISDRCWNLAAGFRMFPCKSRRAARSKFCPTRRPGDRAFHPRALYAVDLQSLSLDTSMPIMRRSAGNLMSMGPLAERHPPLARSLPAIYPSSRGSAGWRVGGLAGWRVGGNCGTALLNSHRAGLHHVISGLGCIWYFSKGLTNIKSPGLTL